MGRRRNKNAGVILWIVMMLVFGNIGFVSRMFTADASPEPVTEDLYMSTGGYHTELTVHEDNSYSVREDIDVEFDTPRHGIYRYIPYKGIITEARKNGDLADIPYYAGIDDISASTQLDVSRENGNQVLRLGDEDSTVYGSQNYKISYHAAPVTNKGYRNVYWNVYPSGWRNEIPAGSTFTITFPKEFDHSNLTFYYGEYGVQKDGSKIIQTDWNGDAVTGTLTESLPVGCGLTVYVPMEKGYFTGMATVGSFNIVLAAVSLAVLLILLLLFFLFGRDEPIIPSVQFQPPAGLDSAAVGYIVDGNASDADLTSLFLFWADRGYIKIRETKDDALAFTKLCSLPEDAPGYERVLFDKVFPEGPDCIGKEVTASSMKYRLADTFGQAKTLLKKEYRNLYTRKSRTARMIGSVLAAIPVFVLTVMMMNVTYANLVVVLFSALYLVGIYLFGHTVDFWYSRTRQRRAIWSSVSSVFCIAPFVVLLLMYGVRMIRGNELDLFPGMLAVSASSVCFMVLTGFMKRRTPQCVEWMGYLAGLRDFIETAELERMQVIAKDSPQLFYHVLPYAYVFGLSDILLDKMKDLTLPAPEWYETRSGSSYFDFYVMHHMFHTNMAYVSQAISTPRPPDASSRSGGFSGGGFGGGGFSGGGFGGGGGGSW